MSLVDLKIENGIIVTVDSDNKIIYDGCICVQNGMICAIGTNEECKDIDAETVIDAQGNLIMPGLINTHTHAGMNIYKGMADDLPLQKWLYDYIFPTEAEFSTKENIITGTELAIFEMLQTGTTCFADMYYFEDSVAEVCDKMHIRAVLGQAIIDFPAPDFQNSNESLAAIEKMIEKYKNHPRIDIIPAPHSMYTCKKETIQKARELANKHNLPIHIHVSETEFEYNESLKNHDKTPTEYLDEIGALDGKTLAAHCVYISEHDREILSKKNVGVANNPQSNLKLVSGIAPVPLMKELNVTVALGTDSVVSNNSLDMFQEMKMAALIHKLNNGNPTVLPAEEVVRMATIDGAKALEIDNLVGSLEVGKQADIIIINLNQPHLTPLYNVYSQIIYAVNGNDVDTVFVDGAMLYQNKQFMVGNVMDTMLNAQIIANQVQKKLSKK